MAGLDTEDPAWMSGCAVATSPVAGRLRGHPEAPRTVVEAQVDATELALMWNPFGGAGQLPFQEGITDVGQGDIDFRRSLGELGDADDHHYIWERDTAKDAPKGEFTPARAS